MFPIADDALSLTFETLEGRDHMQIICVSRWWQSVVRVKVLHRQKSFRPQDLVRYTASFVRPVRIPDTILSRMLELYFPAIDHLDLSLCGDLTDASLLSLLAAKSLTTSKIRHGARTTTPTTTTDLGLTSIDLSQCTKISDEGMLALLAACPTLKRLKVVGCYRLSDRFLVEGLAKHCSTALEELSVADCFKLSTAGIAAVAAASSALRVLDISSCRNMDDGAMAALAGGECRASLTDLSIKGCRDISRHGVQDLAERCPQLQRLNLSSRPTGSDIEVRAVAARCRNLTFLDLSFNLQVGDEAVVAIATGFADLQDLNLSGCKLISDRAMAALAAAVSAATKRQLRSVDVSRCSKLTDAGLDALREKAGGCVAICT